MQKTLTKTKGAEFVFVGVFLNINGDRCGFNNRKERTLWAIFSIISETRKIIFA